MTYNDNETEPDPAEFDVRLQKSALETLELVLKLSNQNTAQQVIAALKFSYFPFSSFCMNVGNDEGQQLQNKYQGWYNDAIKFVKKHGGLDGPAPIPIPQDTVIPVPDPKESEPSPPE